MRADIIGYFKPCMTDIYLHIDARMADYIGTHPYFSLFFSALLARPLLLLLSCSYCLAPYLLIFLDFFCADDSD